MATTSTPYGLVPVGLLGSRPYTGATRLIKMTNSYGTSIFKGDVLKMVATGTCEKDTGTATATPVGIFMGCVYTDPNTSQKIWRNYWTASTVATDNYAYVADDPDLVFQIQHSAGAAIAQTDLNLNAALVQTAGSTVNGMSRVSIASQAVTATLPIRILGILDPAQIGVDLYPDLLCTWVAGMHAYRTALSV